LFAKVKGETSELVQSVITAFIIIMSSVCHMLIPALPKTAVDIVSVTFFACPKKVTKERARCHDRSAHAAMPTHNNQSLKVSENHCGVQFFVYKVTSLLFFLFYNF
jgi:hypothetical protein